MYLSKYFIKLKIKWLFAIKNYKDMYMNEIYGNNIVLTDTANIIEVKSI